MAGAPSMAADNGDFAMINGHTVTVVPGQSSSTTMPMPQLVPMEADSEAPLPPQPPQSAQPAQQADTLPDDVTVEAQPPSASSSDSSSISEDAIHGFEQLMWRTQPSPQCSPMARQVLQGAEYISQGKTTAKIDALTIIACEFQGNPEGHFHPDSG
eukprot:5294337-Amphidinium_carterae.5